MPLHAKDLNLMDKARLQMMEQLKLYIDALERELRDSRLMLEALEASRLVQDIRAMPEAPQLDDRIFRHKPPAQDLDEARDSVREHFRAAE